MTTSMKTKTVILCPGQGAQVVGMGKKWFETSAAARQIFERADHALGDQLGAPLSQICFNGPADRLNQTDVSQPAIYVCSVASHAGWLERGDEIDLIAAAGLSLGEYTALHLAGAFEFLEGLNLVVTRGRLMQDAAVLSHGGMVALIGADEVQAQKICDEVAPSGGSLVLVCANYNAPGQIVLSGHAEACSRAVEVASNSGLKASPLTVAGAFHSPLMQPAADAMAKTLASTSLQMPNIPVWSNVTAEPHPAGNLDGRELLKQRLVEQIVSPVRWSQTCLGLNNALMGLDPSYHELAPGSVLRGLMRRIDRNKRVVSHEEPE
jgi:[acyl-carrier-protein] S-malonyltransferase